MAEQDAFTKAVRNGNLKMVKCLVDNGVNIHAKGDDAIRVAAEYGHLEMVKFLVSQGADAFTLRIYSNDVIRPFLFV